MVTISYLLSAKREDTMNIFGASRRIPTLRHTRTMRSISTNTGPGRGLWLRLQETEHLRWELERLDARRQLHECWQSIQRRPNIHWKRK